MFKVNILKINTDYESEKNIEILFGTITVVNYNLNEWDPQKYISVFKSKYSYN